MGHFSRWVRADLQGCRWFENAPQKRAIVPAAGGIARGRCYGLGAGRDKTPYVPSTTGKVNDLLKLVRGSIAAADSSFTYTSVQIHVNGRSGLHRDEGNMGPSMAIALGPYWGGALCIHSTDSQSFAAAHPHQWTSFSGHDPTWFCRSVDAECQLWHKPVRVPTMQRRHSTATRSSDRDSYFQRTTAAPGLPMRLRRKMPGFSGQRG